MWIRNEACPTTLPMKSGHRSKLRIVLMTRMGHCSLFYYLCNINWTVTTYLDLIVFTFWTGWQRFRTPIYLIPDDWIRKVSSTPLLSIGSTRTYNNSISTIINIISYGWNLNDDDDDDDDNDDEGLTGWLCYIKLYCLSTLPAIMCESHAFSGTREKPPHYGIPMS